MHFELFGSCPCSSVPIINYNRSLVEILKRRDNRFMENVHSIFAGKILLTNKNIKTCMFLSCSKTQHNGRV